MQPRPDKVIPALYGGVIMALLTTVPFLNLINCLCCAGLLLGGVMAVYFYKQNFTSGTPPLTSGDCVLVGLMAGGTGAVIGAVLSSIITALFGNVMIELILKWAEQFSQDIPEEFFKRIEEARFESMSVGKFILELFVNFILYGIFGLVGGLIGYSIFRPKDVPMPPPAANSPITLS